MPNCIRNGILFSPMWLIFTKLKIKLKMTMRGRGHALQESLVELPVVKGPAP